MSREYDKYDIETPYEEMTPEQQNQRREVFCMKLADFLFSTQKTIQMIIQPKIFDKVIDGKEYRLIKNRHFIRLLKRAGFGLSYNDEMWCRNLIQEVFPGWIDLSGLELLLTNLDIWDEKPLSSKHLDYSKITANTVRIFNKIHHDMVQQELTEVADFIGKQNIEKLEVEIGGSLQQLEVIHANKLGDVLRDKGVINYGQDLDEDFVGKLQPTFLNS